MMLSLACALSACHTAPPREHPPTPTEPVIPPIDMPPPSVTDNDVAAPSTEPVKPESPETPSCACMDNMPKPTLKRRAKPVVHEPPPTQTAVVPAPAAAGQPRIKMLDSASASILGKRVRAQDGEDLGRLVDILADREGRVRIAIIEFGGFLGVGNRRIAVDWSLLKFKPGDEDEPVTVDASRAKLQGTPEYKGSERPLALMAPASPPASFK
jgi:hypothetical protein